MTYPEKINWLRQYRAAVRREQMLEGELEAMRSAAELTAPISAPPASSTAHDLTPSSERIQTP